jgi:nucleoid DNA-binding protein
MVERTGLTKRQVKDFFAYLHDLILEQLMRKGIGSITLPIVGVKLTLVNKPATKAHKGRNPFTGEEVKVAAKPARNDVKARVMKALKDAVQTM